MPRVVFHHEKINNGTPLVIETGMDEISWGYNLNVAKFPTYGGEVIQILSAFIDDLHIEGTVRSYHEAERIYSFFMKYFTLATQGPVPNAGAEGHFEQTPMIFQYPERQWLFYIQPLQAPGFTYSLEMVAPQWQMQAHVVDRGLNAESLRELVGAQAQKQLQEFGTLSLSGEISPDGGDPELDPFIAPVTPSTTKDKHGQVVFTPLTTQEVIESEKRLADYHSNLVRNFLKGDYQDVAAFAGSKAIFGRPTSENPEQEKPEELIQGFPKSFASTKVK